MTAAQPGAKIGYIPAVDGLRAVAVGAVILYHLWPGLLPGGFTGVDIFFVISGFVVTGSMAGKRFESLKELLRFFYARRLMRIMPALVAMLLVTILATQLFIPESWLSNGLAVVGNLAFPGLSNIALAFDRDTYFGPAAPYDPFLHTWSLGVEEQFYLLFPFLLYRRQSDERGVIRLVAMLAIGSFLLCGVLGFFQPKLAFYLIVTRFWELGAGMLLCLLYARWKPRLEALAGTARAAFVPTSLALVAGGLVIPAIETAPFPLALLPVAGTAGLIAVVCAFPGGSTARALAARPMVAIGRLSYSLYLWHWPVFVLLRWTVGLSSLPLQLTALALTCLLAVASYVLVERPLRTAPRIAAAPRGKVVGLALGTVALASAAGVAMFAAHDRITLSVTRDHNAWYADERHALNPDISQCRVRTEVRRFERGILTVWTPERCKTAPEGFTVYALGDSHNRAYYPNYRQLAAELGVTVKMYWASCPVLKLNQTHASRPQCAPFYDKLFAEIAKSARPGDVIFLPSLRVKRLGNQFENDRDILSAKDDSVTADAMAEAKAIVDRLADPGAWLVIEAPKPVFRSPPFRCSDWFNRANAICAGGLSIPRAELLARQKPISDAIAALAVHQPRLFIWDPFPALCPHATCEAVPGGKPLFFDGDHLSGAGNDLLYPGLRGAILAASRSAR